MTKFATDDLPPDEKCTIYWYDDKFSTLHALRKFRRAGNKAFLLWDLASDQFCIIVDKVFNIRDIHD
jgi:hypothetical protein